MQPPSFIVKYKLTTISSQKIKQITILLKRILLIDYNNIILNLEISTSEV